ncbi:hypothetical protein EJ07DRAFT_151811 [Lizonia empirigonia]|nr:hypothetical protein EJ07DRAFT_151811 [Lizonia empirigonia]
MGRPKLSLHAPADHTITLTSAEGASDSFFLGQLFFSNVPPQCDIQITLTRVGRLKQGTETKGGAASNNLLSELGFLGAQKEQRREQFDYDTAEKLSGVSIVPSQTTAGSKTVKCNFELPIPSYLPATAALPSVDISYAIFATCTLPSGKVAQCSQVLRLVRENVESIGLEPSHTVSFPDSPLAVRASFDAPDLSSKNLVIPTTLQLQGLSLSSINSMRTNETRWLVPREIKWEFEETAILVTGVPDATGHIPMSIAQRVMKKRKLATGKEKLKLNYPFTRKGNTSIHMLDDGTGMEIPFTVNAPKSTSLGDSTALSVAGGHVLHTVLSHEASPETALPQKRFAVYLEYKLHMWLRIGEDVFDEASGDLVNRKMDEMAYTILCPLTTQQALGQEDGEEPLPVIPPSYDGLWEQPPPDYTTFS